MKNKPILTLKTAEFLAESNRIEGYNIDASCYMSGNKNMLRPTDCAIVKNSLHVLRTIHMYNEKGKPLNENQLCFMHQNLMKDLLNPKYVGEYRQVPVQVGSSIPPMPASVPYLMDEWIEMFNKKEMSALDIHKHFEYIHPFIDGNGRMGRLLWALDKLQRGEKIHSFLEEYTLHYGDFYDQRNMYYDSLANYSMKQKLKDMLHDKK